MPPADPNARTFSLQTLADLFRKMRFEAGALRQAPPDDLTERAYAVMTADASVWQMKDLVYEVPKVFTMVDFQIISAMSVRLLRPGGRCHGGAVQNDAAVARPERLSD